MGYILHATFIAFCNVKKTAFLSEKVNYTEQQLKQKGKEKQFLFFGFRIYQRKQT